MRGWVSNTTISWILHLNLHCAHAMYIVYTMLRYSCMLSYKILGALESCRREHALMFERLGMRKNYALVQSTVPVQSSDCIPPLKPAR